MNWFHRGDEDRDPHDHPWDFWTFPLRGYYEEHWEPDRVSQCWTHSIRWVAPFRWHWRSAEHLHRVLGPNPRYEPDHPARILTLVRVGQRRRKWTFSVEDSDARYGRANIPWQRYLCMPEDTPDE